MALLPYGSAPDKWNKKTFGSTDFLQPKVTTQGQVLGSDVDASVLSTFSGTSAVFNGEISGSFSGINYFLTLAYGTSFLGLGGLYTSGHALGTPSSPTQTLNSNFLGGHIFTGYDGAGSWVVNAAAHALTGLWSQASADVGGAVNIAGGVGKNLSTGGAVNIIGGNGFNGGSVFIDVGGGLA